MSIWCSYDHIGTDPLISDFTQNGEVRAYATGFSNHYPTTDGDWEVPASVNLADIAPWCTPGHNQSGEGYACSSCGDSHDHPQSGGWIRLDIDAAQARNWWRKDADGVPAREDVFASVVLDVEAARSLAAQLTAWADGEHLAPVPAEMRQNA